MLEELHVRGLALIDEAWLEFSPRLTALTGETGAGKTVLLQALKLLLGERADSQMVRAGASEALVEGRFCVDGEELLVRRRVSAEGRSKCYLNGEIASVTELAASVGPLVDLHGQHDHQSLLSPANHARYLDRFAGEPARSGLAAYREAKDELARAAAARDALAEALSDRERRGEMLRDQLGEIDALDPHEGEDVQIEARLPRMRHAERLLEASVAAFGALRDEGAAGDRLGEAVLALRGATGLDPALDDLADRLEGALAEAEDVGSALRDYGESLDFDSRALNDAEGRLAALATLKREYGPSLQDVLASRDEAVRQLEALESGDRGLAEAEQLVVETEWKVRRAAERLADVRAKTAPRFARQLTAAASDLAMGRALIDVAFTELPFAAWTGDGPHKVEFLYAPDGTEPARPLARIASGGEVSRVMLALKGVLGGADDVPVLVFDEIDAGVGGATALAVGRRLAELARDHQVLVVTHLPQVAAFADRHLVVARGTEGGRAVTSVRAVEGPERVAEVARMLAGGESEASLAHARELIDSVEATA